MNNINVVFMGTPTFSVPILEMLIEKYNVVGVVTQPDKLVGRKKVLTFSPIKEVALKNNIKVLTPSKLRLEFQSVLDLNPDIIVTCAYGQIVPKEILEFPKYGCINVHGSLLPKYRGGAPIQRSIMNGDEKTGITIMYMNEGLDTGDMIDKEEVIIENDDNYETLSNKLKVVGRDLLDRTLVKIINGENKRIVQNNECSTYAPIITRDDEKIDFNKTAKEIYNQVRGLSPNPGVFANFEGKVVKVYNSRISDKSTVDSINGKIINIYDDGIGISTSDFEIIFTDIKFEGKNRMLVKNYLNGISSDKLLGKFFE